MARRCYTFGPPSVEAREFWKRSVECLHEGLDALRPGAPAHAFSDAIERVMGAAGFELGWSDPNDTHHMYSLHGIGTDAIQGVWVPGKDRELRENEVVNLHPTLEFSHEDLTKYGWLGITDNAIITPNGGQLMTLQRDLSDAFVEL